ncbi:MAG TPA: RES family NAD+ phosphorylase [Acidimicrobiales bacterium]|nr:RES family NAD+ phosphorylase [Acidimicrobiales bacterium]
MADPAVTDGRYHVVGGIGTWYASSQEQAAWAELFRHFLGEGVDPFEIRRRVGHVEVDRLVVLDLTDAAVRSALGVTETDLVSDDYAVTQRIAKAAASAGFEGILAPSAALPGRTTLVVFSAGMRAVAPGISRVRQPPSRMADLLRVIRPHPDMPGSVRQRLRSRGASGSQLLRRERRRRS